MHLLLDLMMSKSKRVIQGLLENELNTLRKTKSGALSSTDDGKKVFFLGKKNDDFKFEHLSKINVAFCESITKPNEEHSVDLSEIKNWVSNLV